MASGIRTYTVLLILALVSWWVSGLFSLEPEPFTPQASNAMEYYANNFTVTVTDENGMLKHRLQAVSMNHFSDRNISELEKPVVTIFNPTKPPWVIQSDTGTVSPNGTHIFFGGDVFIDREGTTNLRPVKIVTKNLQVEPEKRYAETDEQADIFSEPDNVSGIGMRVFFSNPIHLTLLSKVRGKYEVH